MPADRVVASAGTITGSIGVLAGKQVIRETLERVGVRAEQVAVGRYADMFSTDRPFDDDEWARLEGWLDRVYDDFTSKAAEDRGMPVEAAPRSRPRPGLDRCRRAGARARRRARRPRARAGPGRLARAGIDREEVEVRVVPKPNLVERFLPADNSESPAAASALGVAGLLGDRRSAGVRDAAGGRRARAVRRAVAAGHLAPAVAGAGRVPARCRPGPARWRSVRTRRAPRRPGGR